MSQQLTLNPAIISVFTEQLNRHPLYAEIRTLAELRIFMAHHVYSVWDFMSLLKCLQNWIAPTTIPWTPTGSPSARFFINQIVLGEESDEGLPDSVGHPTYISHFELYCEAMREIGANPSEVLHFAEIAAQQGIDAALASGIAPSAAYNFMQSTFDFIKGGQPHIVGAAFAFGREHIIPTMFRALLAKMQITAKEAPIFYYYLERHIHLDGDLHTPLSLRMVEELINGDGQKAREVESAAHAAVQARLQFWDGVRIALGKNRSYISSG